MNEIHFVFEKPNKPGGTRKRSRLVTSCDACRSRKIKCRPSNYGDNICEACKASGCACVYQERDRIRAQRGIANFTVTPNCEPSSSTVTQLSGTSSVRVLKRRLPPRHASSSEGIRPDQTSVSAAPVTLPSVDDSNSNLTVENAAINIASETVHLFDPKRKNYPHPNLLLHFVHTFLLYSETAFPFFDTDYLISAASSATLPPLIANTIAAYSARFSDYLSHVPGERHLSGDPYLKVAESLVSSSDDIETIDRLHALIVMAWTENGSGNSANFWKYGRSAASLAMELKLGSEEYICNETSESSRNSRRMAFWSVSWLEIAASTVVGKPPLFQHHECNTNPPYPELHFCGSLSRTSMYRTLRIVFYTMRKLHDISNAVRPDAPSTYRDTGLREIRRMVMGIFYSIDPSLAYNKVNLLQANSQHEVFIFSLLHYLIHTMVIVVHCPSLFFRSQSTSSLADIPRLDLAWTSGLAVIDIFVAMQEVNPHAAVALSSFFIPISIARGALMLAANNKQGVIYGTHISFEQFEDTNSLYLNQSHQLLMNLSIFWENMLQIKIASQPVKLYGTQYSHTHSQSALTSSSHQYQQTSASNAGTPISTETQFFTHNQINELIFSRPVVTINPGIWHGPPVFYRRIDLHNDGHLGRAIPTLTWTYPEQAEQRTDLL